MKITQLIAENDGTPEDPSWSVYDQFGNFIRDFETLEGVVSDAQLLKTEHPIEELVIKL